MKKFRDTRTICMSCGGMRTFMSQMDWGQVTRCCELCEIETYHIIESNETPHLMIRISLKQDQKGEDIRKDFGVMLGEVKKQVAGGRTEWGGQFCAGSYQFKIITPEES